MQIENRPHRIAAVSEMLGVSQSQIHKDRALGTIPRGHKGQMSHRALAYTPQEVIEICRHYWGSALADQMELVPPRYLQTA